MAFFKNFKSSQHSDSLIDFYQIQYQKLFDALAKLSRRFVQINLNMLKKVKRSSNIEALGATEPPRIIIFSRLITSRRLYFSQKATLQRHPVVSRINAFSAIHLLIFREYGISWILFFVEMAFRGYYFS